MTQFAPTPRPLVIQAVKRIKEQGILPGIAIDFGCGGGDESVYLLQQGYRVIAIDNFRDFLTELALKEAVIPHLSYLKTLHENFEDLSWDQLPQIDLFIAPFSLCFIQKDSFLRVFSNILNQIKPGGYFAGELYTHLVKNRQEDGYFLEEQSNDADENGLVHEPFMTKEDIFPLFKAFTIEYCEDVAKLYKNTPVKTSPHKNNQKIYSIIARKDAH